MAALPGAPVAALPVGQVATASTATGSRRAGRAPGEGICPQPEYWRVSVSLAHAQDDVLARQSGILTEPPAEDITSLWPGYSR